MSKIRIRAKTSGGVTTVKALLKHPMETGFRVDRKTGSTVPPDYITRLIASWRDEVILDADWGPGISRNPFFSFRFRGGKAGDMIRISWTDNQGVTHSDTAEIKQGD